VAAAGGAPGSTPSMCSGLWYLHPREGVVPPESIPPEHSRPRSDKASPVTVPDVSPNKPYLMRADQLSGCGVPLMLREQGQDDTAWRLVVQRPVVKLVPDATNPEERSPVSDWLQEVSVKLADGTELLFNHSDMVEVRPPEASPSDRA
jgi:hypothetical protein